MITIFIILSVILAMATLALFMTLSAERKGAERLVDEQLESAAEIDKQMQQVEAQKQQIEAQRQQIEALREQLRNEQSEAQRQLSNAQLDSNTLRGELKAANDRYIELNNRMKEQEQQREKQQQREQEQQREHFKNLATDILNEQSKQLRESSKVSIGSLLDPFKQDITNFKERVEKIYSQENEQRGALKNELERLLELNHKITTETANLTNALRGNSKVQGDWGEMILETILESSNLVKGSQYFTQTNFKDEDGNNLRPDVVLNLPEGKRIVIDSKTSLTAFVNYVNCEDVDERRQHLDSHIVSVRQHIKELSNKEYQKVVLKSPDFVIMFIPSEPAFLAALQADNTLWSEAYERKVIISSPTNLFALLKLVDDLWKRNSQNRNTADIVKVGTKLYDQLVNFTTQFEGVGSALENAQAKYSDAYKRLTSGNDNIIRNGERLRALGLPTKRRQGAKALANNEIDVVAEDGELFDQISTSSSEESER
ncbi:MAG: DNA recombination protein RmuC [Rikenellaceae bacterium]